MTREIRTQLAAAPHPSHVFVQAGVGGLAAAVAQGLHDCLAAPQGITIVEPAAAACVAAALAAGRPVPLSGSLQTCAEMLSCGLASAPALDILLAFRPMSVVLSEAELQGAVALLHACGGPKTTASGAAGIAGFVKVAENAARRQDHGMDEHSTVLLVITEA